MSEPYIGEIRMFAGDYAPKNWSLCDGQLLAISQNNSLFSLLGTAYGGDGRTTFALPDMRGRLPVHQGTGPGLTTKNMGKKYGKENVTIKSAQMPAHNHSLNVTTDIANSSDPTNNVLAAQSDEDLPYYESDIPSTNTQDLNSNTLSTMGKGQSHNNMMPSLCVNFIIAVFGVYPSRT